MSPGAPAAVACSDGLGNDNRIGPRSSSPLLPLGRRWKECHE
jgi:hypothetical protein